ncbi:MAG: polyprenyl synthetase family protein [Dehalococcoidia bacterium]
MRVEALYGPVQKDLALVEEALASLKEVDFPPLAQMLDLVLRAGGKRLRPALALLAGHFHDYRLDLLVPLAASIELLHTATLVHDDVIDNARTRRGHPTANSVFHNSTTVMLGDYMFAHAAHLVARTGNLRVIRLFAETLRRMAAGEIVQDMTAYDASQTVQSYLQRIGGKTASLFATACEGGAIVSGAPEAWVTALRDYGHNLGLSFQIVDDILDFIGEEEQLGKPVGSDLMQGTLTLPSLLLLERHPDGNPIRPLFAQPQRQEYLEQAVAMIRDSDIPQQAYDIARVFGDSARRALAALPPSPRRQTLLDIVSYVLERRT